jgi:hypothetical protein
VGFVASSQEGFFAFWGDDVAPSRLFIDQIFIVGPFICLTSTIAYLIFHSYDATLTALPDAQQRLASIQSRIRRDALAAPLSPSHTTTITPAPAPLIVAANATTPIMQLQRQQQQNNTNNVNHGVGTPASSSSSSSSPSGPKFPVIIRATVQPAAATPATATASNGTMIPLASRRLVNNATPAPTPLPNDVTPMNDNDGYHETSQWYQYEDNNSARDHNVTLPLASLIQIDRHSRVAPSRPSSRGNSHGRNSNGHVHGNGNGGRMAANNNNSKNGGRSGGSSVALVQISNNGRLASSSMGSERSQNGRLQPSGSVGQRNSNERPLLSATNDDDHTPIPAAATATAAATTTTITTTATVPAAAVAAVANTLTIPTANTVVIASSTTSGTSGSGTVSPPMEMASRQVSMSSSVSNVIMMGVRSRELDNKYDDAVINRLHQRNQEQRREAAATALATYNNNGCVDHVRRTSQSGMWANQVVDAMAAQNTSLNATAASLSGGDMEESMIDRDRRRAVAAVIIDANNALVTDTPASLQFLLVANPPTMKGLRHQRRILMTILIIFQLVSIMLLIPILVVSPSVNFGSYSLIFALFVWHTTCLLVIAIHFVVFAERYTHSLDASISS